MKQLNFILAVLCLSLFSMNAQNVAINDDNSNADANAILDVKSTTKGVLFPRLTTAQRTTLGSATPTEGMLVFDTDTKSYWFFASGAWVDLSSGSGSDVPVGTVLPYAGSISEDMNVNIPDEPISGWLLCNGDILNNNTHPQYTTLFNTIMEFWGDGGDQHTYTVHLPDLRGMFLRGVTGERNDNRIKQDTITTNRVAMNNGGNVGNGVGSYQADAFQGHKHSLNPYSEQDRFTHGGGGMLYWDPNQPFQTSDPINDGVNGDPRTSSESRPKNAFVHYIIKY